MVDLFKKNWSGKPMEDPVDIGKKNVKKKVIHKRNKTKTGLGNL